MLTDCVWISRNLWDVLAGYYPPNASFGATLLAKPLNTTTTKIGPWVAHTTYTYEAIEGLFRHNAQDAAIKLATEHVRSLLCQSASQFTCVPTCVRPVCLERLESRPVSISGAENRVCY
jgi:hypothetical protein